MPIITISRGSYSRGKDVAEKLAQRLGYECLSRDLLIEASDEFNIPEIKLIRALHDAPTVLERFSHGKERYVAFLRSSLLEHTRKDNVVYHGLAGHFFLRDISHVLKVRILANIEDRVKEEMRREKISAEEARYILKKDDEERRKWGIKVYGVDTLDSKLYDIVINVSSMTVDDAVDILCEAIKKTVYQTTPESQKKLEDLALAARVQTALMHLAPKVNVTASSGLITIGNIDEREISRPDTVAMLEKIAKKVEGVNGVCMHMTSGREKPEHINPFYNM
ncbi:Cmk2 [Desulforapulum autotrophicum HRM2]|uniref:Cmk2 n=1 Tax=Desulforapulum autotrophicum (strain ATCC 43914 / DSM 3382 / VKM B-1955 / HRM2) TaxID=177437 RepID=C0QBH9_DESAH|nr:cytidylate kinase-like family protein [Desulforapulum autotrophicum]ACN16981.1 Cmk2 [Desulforapulum autotrophicum HRM2]